MGRQREGIVKYQSNPFLDNTKYKTRNKRVSVQAGRQVLLDRDTGELQAPTEVMAVYQVDGEQFIKIYTSQIRSLFELGPAAFRLMEVVFAKVQHEAINKDTIYLNSKAAEEYFQKAGRQAMSRATYDRAVRELLEKRILAQSELPHLYFINPHIFFNGDRVRFISEYRKKKPAPDNRQMDLEDFIEGNHEEAKQHIELHE
jgi:hypothetical protein